MVSADFALSCPFFLINVSEAENLLPELEYQLKNSDAKVLLVHPSKAALAREVAQSVGLPPSSVFLFVNPNEKLGETARALKPWMSFWVSVDEAKVWQWHRIRNIEEAKQTTAIINYSSGYVQFLKTCHWH